VTHVGFSLLTLLPDRVGGSETYVRSLLREFSEGRGPERTTVLANPQVARAYRGRLGGSVALDEVTAYRQGDSTPGRALAMARAAALPRAVARQLPGDLDVVHYPVTVPIPATRLPTVVTIHEVQRHERPEVFSRAERLYRRFAYDGSARRASVVVAVTRHVRDLLADRVGVEPGRIEVVHLGIDLERFAPEPLPDDESATAALPPRYVLYPANLWPHKNHERLIDAFAAVPDRDLSLVLVGQTYGRLDPLLARARARGLEGRVSHGGFVAPERLPAFYRHAEATVFPSLYEGFGMPPLEAMACGCPVTSSKRASLAEVCGDAVLELDPGDPDSIAGAIERVVADAELREELRRRGLDHAARFSWRAAAEGHVRAYERAAKGRTEG